MGRKLAVNVTVGADTYSAGSEVPDEVAELITNPKVWGDEPEPEESEQPEAVAEQPEEGEQPEPDEQ